MPVRSTSFYSLVSGSSWELAKSAAINLGGNLVTINDASESSWLVSNLTWNQPSNTSYGAYAHDGSIAYWIGLTDIDGNYAWADGTAVNYINGSFSNDNEDFFTLDNNGHWNDLSESTKSWFQLGYGIAEVPLSYFSISDLSLTEGDSGNITISRTGGTNTSQTLSLVSSNGTAISGSDYTSINQSISFAKGETSKTVSVSSIEDTTFEASESFTITLTASGTDAVPAQITDGLSTVSIADDDLGSYTISPSVTTINEGERLSTTITQPGEGDNVAPLYWSVSGTGIDSSDLSEGSLQSWDNDGQYTIYHTFANDKKTEGDETLSIKLFSDSGRTTQVGETATVTIKDTSIDPDATIKIIVELSFNYTFINQGDNQYGIKSDSSSTIDSLTGISTVKFSDKSIDIIKDVVGTFNQITGKDDVTGRMFRLYNAAFARFPDADGLKYWISKNASGENSNRVVAKSFLASAEFSDRYGSNVTNEKYVETLYTNVLGRNSDVAGYNYWVGNLNNGIETRYEALLGFAESAENKALFTEVTGIS